MGEHGVGETFQQPYRTARAELRGDSVLDAETVHDRISFRQDVADTGSEVVDRQFLMRDGAVKLAVRLHRNHRLR